MSEIASRPIDIGLKTERNCLNVCGREIRTEKIIEVRNPYTGNVVGFVPSASRAEVAMALEMAFNYRATLSRHERYTVLMRARDLVFARRDQFAQLISLESGLSINDALYETGRAQDVLLFSANQALVDDGQIFSCDLTDSGKERKIYTLREPLNGLISAITPFNHPLNQVVHKIAPSVATNNRMVLKPSEKTPLTAYLFADVMYEAGLPCGMLSIITGEPEEIGIELVTNKFVELVTFTGGVNVGKFIASKSVYKRQILELGGNDPIIIMEDADLDKAAALAVSGSYKNSGQRCTAIKRMLVHAKIADEFVELLSKKTKEIRYGDPFDPNVQMGTVINDATARHIESVVGSAISEGATLVCGHIREGSLYSPTVLDNVRPEMRVVKYETFGPVSPVIRFNSIEEAIHISNSTSYGLSSSVCTDRWDHVKKFVKELNVGTVNVWEVPGYRLEISPFGGIKDSGLGYKEGVQEAIKGFTTVKTYSLPW